ncbi:MAG TPA: DUF6498-containing protein [Thermoanaerobaculia bacterium]|nr:DUF6498-containing protein [Thermoanaerobaculia bacterium]
MNRFGRLTHLVGFNAIAITGVFFRGWADGTAVALYWCESLIFVLSVSILVALHRRLTNKSGHFFRRGTYNKSFLTTSFVCVLIQIPFLFTLLGLFGVGGGVDLHSLAGGVAGAAVFVLIGFVISLAGLRDRPFAWVKQATDFALWRVFVIFIAIFIGGFGGVVLNRPHTLVYAFTALRLFTDIVGQFPEYNPDEPPRWFIKLFGAGSIEDWHRKRARERSFAAGNEIPLPR